MGIISFKGTVSEFREWLHALKYVANGGIRQ